LGIALLWTTHSTWLWLDRLQSERLIFYQVAGFSQVDRIQSGYYTPRLLAELPEDKEAYHLQGHRLRHAPLGIWPQEPIHPAWMTWKNQIFLFLEQDSLQVPEQLQVDYLILGKDRIRSLDQLPESLGFQKLIIDGSNSRTTANRLKSQAMQANLPHHSILHEGALILK
jgi:hypothetical protein